jgi:hypothetical protein
VSGRDGKHDYIGSGLISYLQNEVALCINIDRQLRGDCQWCIESSVPYIVLGQFELGNLGENTATFIIDNIHYTEPRVIFARQRNGVRFRKLGAGGGTVSQQNALGSEFLYPNPISETSHA